MITPDEHHDWIGQRSEAFDEFYPLGTKEAKAGRADDAIFKLSATDTKLEEMHTSTTSHAMLVPRTRDE